MTGPGASAREASARGASAHPARAVSITACPDGPLLVRGDLALFDENGVPIEPNRRTFALCRCGASAVRPFCDGSHKLVGFRTGPPPQTPAVTFEEDEPLDAAAAEGSEADLASSPRRRQPSPPDGLRH